MAHLPDAVLEALRRYWKNTVPHPASWLFYGASPERPMTARSLRAAFKRSRDRGGLDRGITFHCLRHAIATHLYERRAFSRLIRQARKTPWVVYAKPPFNGPEAVIRYLSRYTHRIAISDARILAFDGKTVTFRCRKPLTKASGKPNWGAMTLLVETFIRRFLMHRLPKGFHRIRHFGILANSCRSATLEAVPQADRRDAGDTDEPADDKAPAPACPRCGTATVPVATLDRNISAEGLARTMESTRMRGPP